MLNVIQVIQLPIGNFDKVVDRETVVIGPQGLPQERMIGTLPALVESLEWTKGYAGAGNSPSVVILVCVNGGTLDDAGEIRGYLKSLDLDWRLIQSHTVEPEARCIEMFMEECRYEFTAIVPGHVLVREDQWFEKMQQVFLKDRQCGLVGTDKDLTDNTMTPFRLRQGNHPSGPIVLLRKNLISEIRWSEMPEGCHVPTELSKQVVAMSGNVWASPSVRFSEQEWELQQPEKLDITTLSE